MPSTKVAELQSDFKASLNNLVTPFLNKRGPRMWPREEHLLNIHKAPGLVRRT